MLLIVLLLGGLLAVGLGVSVVTPGPAVDAWSPPPELRRALERHRVPGAVIAVVRDGEVAVTALGEAAEGRPMTADTVLQAASLSKPVVAYAALLLVAEGELDLDRPAVAYLPPEQAPPGLDDEVTLRSLLTHSAGLPNHARGGSLRPRFEPGSRWSYSGEGYRLLQRVLEARTDQGLEALLQRRVLGPLGMASSTFGEPPTGQPAAVGHRRDGGRVDLARAQPPQPDAAGSLLTTARDYARFLAHILDEARRGGTAARMMEPRVTVDGDLDLHWGLGWGLWTGGGEGTFFHWGSNPGFESFALGEVARGRGVVVLTNGHDGLECADEVAEITMDRTYPFFSFPLLHPTG